MEKCKREIDLITMIEYIPAANTAASPISGVALGSCTFCLLLIPLTNLLNPLIICCKKPPLWTLWPFVPTIKNSKKD